MPIKSRKSPRKVRLPVSMKSGKVMLSSVSRRLRKGELTSVLNAEYGEDYLFGARKTQGVAHD